MKSIEIPQEDFKAIEDAVGVIKSLAVALPQLSADVQAGQIKEIILQTCKIQRHLENGTLLDYSDMDEAGVRL